MSTPTDGTGLGRFDDQPLAVRGVIATVPAVLVLMHVLAAVVCIVVVPDWTSDVDATPEAVSEADAA